MVTGIIVCKYFTPHTYYVLYTIYNTYCICGTVLIGLYLENKSQKKGGCILFWMDVHHCYPRAYIHCHKLQTRPIEFNVRSSAACFND